MNLPWNTASVIRSCWVTALAALLWLLVVLGPATTHARTGDFSRWLETLRQEALDRGIRPATVDSALKTIRQPQRRVIQHDRNQPEKKQQVADYVRQRVSPQRIADGVTMLQRYPTWLGRIEQRFAVQQRFIVALLGIETHYGRYTGGFPVLQALATLAYDGRRASFFRRELLDALHIIDAGHVAPWRMKGSWAGAMGQCQFMPSSFRHYAADGNGDQRIDIWGTLPDVFASTANYLKQAGWKHDQTWGRQVRLPQHLDQSLLGLKTRLPLARWQQLGVRRTNGHDLPQRNLQASLIQPDGPGSPAYLVYDNYHALLRWNRSHTFALAVGLLADALAADRSKTPPKH